jgi:rare lipoprotein A (peptidoglycan hydrolase)
VKRLLAAGTLVAALPLPVAAAARHSHVPGCLTGSCDKRIGKRWARRHRSRPRASIAVASWYGPGFYGHSTACGQILTPKTWGVAHKALACGTKVRLCVRRCVVAPVIDRGPYVGGRDFDLTAPVRDAIGAGSLATVRYSVVG